MKRNYRKHPHVEHARSRPVICQVRPALLPLRPAPVDKPGPRALAWPRLSLWRKKLERPIISEAPASDTDNFYHWPTTASVYGNTSTERVIYGYGSGTTYASDSAKSFRYA